MSEPKAWWWNQTATVRFVASEEEGLILSVVDFRKDDWPAQREGPVPIGLICDGLSGAIREESVGKQIRFANMANRAAVQIVGAGAKQGIEGPAASAAGFGVVGLA